MAAVQNQLGGRKVESIVLCGRTAVHAELARAIETELGMPAELFDPFAGLELAPALQDSPPEHPGRFAPLLGMLLAELSQTGHAIDFLHPRRRAESPSRRRKVDPGRRGRRRRCCWPICTYARIEHYLLAGEVERLEAQLQGAGPVVGGGQEGPRHGGRDRQVDRRRSTSGWTSFTT